MKTLSFLPLLLFSIVLNAKSYYVSVSGNDNNNGLTSATPWQTITKLNSFSFAANDSILFHRGDTFYGGIIVKRSNLNFGAYGSGVKPVITGLSTVSGWVSLGNNIWEAPVNNVKADVNLVIRDNHIQQVGRYPNADAPNGGYLTYTASSSTTITGSAISSKTDWTGAQVAIRCNRWTIRTQRITAHTAGTLTFPFSDVTPRVDYGYFIQRDARTLDKDGEWWYDSSSSKLRVYSLLNPATYTYKIATVDVLLSASLLNNIVVTDLQFTGAGRRAVWIYSGTNQTISNVDVKFSGAEGISTLSAFNVQVINCTTNNCLASGIRVYNNNADPVKLSVTNCLVDSTALVAGMEIGDVVANGSNGICVRGNKNTIQYNVVKNSGYCGIEWQGNDVSIKYNVVSRFCSVRDDGGGIYTLEAVGSNLPVRTNRVIIGNIVMYAIGANAGAKSEGAEQGNSARGLYFDQGTRTVIADSNTVAYCIGTAVHGNNNASLTFTNNTFYGNKGGFSFQRLSDGPLIRNMLIKKNISYPYYFEYRNLAINIPSLMTATQDVSAIGIIDSNFYRKRPGLDSSMKAITTYNTLTNYAESIYSFDYIKTNLRFESNSKIMKDSGSFYFNDSRILKNITLDGKYADVNGYEYNGQVNLKPFSSLILFRLGDITPTLSVGLGSNLLLSLPTNSVSVKGIITGSPVSYQWSKIFGPSQYVIASPSSQNTVISNLVAGKYSFRLLVKNSAGDSAFSTLTIEVAGVLPVKLVDFTADKIDSKVQLYWKTSSELNVSHYSIERSSNGQLFEEIGQTISKNVSSSEANYTFTDHYPLDGNNFYRLAMVDKDGSVAYSKVIMISVENTVAYTVQQLTISSASNELKIGLNSNFQQQINIIVTDVSGRSILRSNFLLQKGFNAVNKQIPGIVTGIYYVSLVAKDQRLSKTLLTTR